jgi:hypothetical protein
LRALPPDRLGERGGAPELTVAKHLLRDWVEASLAPVDNAVDARQLEQPLNDRLRAADLTCENVSDPHGKRCDDQADGPLFSARGYLGSIRVMLPETGGRLVLTTAVGIECGYDESAYVYERRDGAWHRIFESERNDYTKDGYRPQNFEQVLVSPKESGKQPLVLTTGISPWCSSNWQAVYYRLFRVTPDQVAAPALLDREEGIYAGVDQPVRSSLGRDEALIEFQDRSIDLDVFTRTVVRHFRVGPDDTIVRAGPYALTPRAAVDEWLVRPWGEAALFTDPASRPRLASRHRWLHKHSVAAEYSEDGGRCRSDPTLWVIGIWPDKSPHTLYFRLRWIAPFDFTVLDIGRKPPAGCRAQPIALDETAQQFPDLSAP